MYRNEVKEEDTKGYIFSDGENEDGGPIWWC